MKTPLSNCNEDEILSRVTTRIREFSVDTDNEFFIYVLKCNPEITLRKRLDGWNDKKMIKSANAGEDAWFEYPARAKPPLGDYEFNYSPWVEQAVEADEVYYVGQTRDLRKRIVNHANATNKGAYATSLFPPESLIHIESAGDKQTAVTIEDLIAEFITYGSVLQGEGYLSSGKVPNEIHSRLSKFENQPDLDFEGEIHFPFLYAEPNDSKTANLVYRLNQLDTVIAPWDEFDEMDAYPIDPCHISDWYITSMELSASPVISDYQEETLIECIDEFKSWLESSETYAAPCEPDEKMEVDSGIESSASAKEYFWDLHEKGKKRIVESFVTKNRKKVRDMHPTPLRFAYADESIETKLELDGQATTDGSSENSTPTTEGIKDLTQEEQSRLKDVIERSPTTNGELQRCWGLSESADVHHYLENHLSYWYYRDSNSRIRVTDDAKEKFSDI